MDSVSTVLTRWPLSDEPAAPSRNVDHVRKTTTASVGVFTANNNNTNSTNTKGRFVSFSNNQNGNKNIQKQNMLYDLSVFQFFLIELYTCAFKF